MKLTKEQIQEIQTTFASMRSRTDFLSLLNSVKKMQYGEKCHPFTMQQLLYHANPKLNKKRYSQFSIPKKTGGERSISAPCKGLKEIQMCLNIILQAVYTPHKNAFGFVPEKSIVDNAKKHIGNTYIYNIDLKDFFPSIDQARVWGRLLNPPFNLQKETRRIFCNISINIDDSGELMIVEDKETPIEKRKFTTLANMIASLCCHEMEVERMNVNGTWEKVIKNVLPQGAPTSPTLTNIICERLDKRLTGVAKRFGLKYSRYADDITFSSMHNVYQKDSEFITELERIIREQGFHIKQSKTRLQKTGYRQEVTGLIVSEDRVNVPQRYTKQLRKWLYMWEHYGYEKTYNFFLPNYVANKNQPAHGTPNMANILAGKLEFLKMVKGEKNSTYLKLRERFEKLHSCQKSIIIRSTLDIWEEEGIEKAMEFYYKNNLKENVLPNFTTFDEMSNFMTL